MVQPSAHDIEGNRPFPNPYSTIAGPPVPGLYHPINILKRMIYSGISLFGLYHLNAYQAVLHSPHIRHEWFKIGLAATVALLGIKAYVELFEGRLQKKTVNYANYPQCTHSAIALFLISSVAFHIALWPYYRWNSFLVLGMAFFGVILQFLLLTPTWLQNIVSFVLLTFFLQEYS